jgi:hypothetical protein
LSCYRPLGAEEEELEELLEQEQQPALGQVPVLALAQVQVPE